MKIHQNFKYFEHFILRTPLKPIDFYFNIDNIFKDFDSSINEILSSEFVLESLYIASTSIYQTCKFYLEKNITNPKKKNEFKFSLMQYLIRMSTRCTPFGLFAGCTIGKISNSTVIKLLENEYNNLHLRLDMDLLCNIVENLSKNELIKKNLKYFKNTSIFKLSTKYRYYDYHYINQLRKYNNTSFESNIFIDSILKMTRFGCYYNDIIEFLSYNGLEFEESHNLLDSLIENKILLNEFEPSVTGDEFYQIFFTILKNTNLKNELLYRVESIYKQLDVINSNKIGGSILLYETTSELIKSLEIPLLEKNLFQVDMYKDSEVCEIDKNLVENILKSIDFLKILTVYTNNIFLSDFKKVFMERFGDKEVPLYAALDPESGINLNHLNNIDLNPLIEDIPLINLGLNDDIKFNKIQIFLLKYYVKNINNNNRGIVFNDEDFSELDDLKLDLPSTFSVFGNLLSNNFNNQSLIYLKGIMSYAAKLISRFCYSNEKINNLVKEITLKEQEINKNVILAEIVHLPQSRTGNILTRPHLRDYEIPYLCKSTLPYENQIQIDDLVISIKYDKIILRSKRLNKEIIPTLTNAHNYSNNSLPIYEFLCNLSYQNCFNSLGFSWGPLENIFTYLPRVTYKNIILSPATWIFNTKEISKIFDQTDNEILLSDVKSWREKEKLPKLVNFVEGDNLLLLNLSELIHINLFNKLIRKKAIIKLEEFLFESDSFVVENNEGKFTNEFILCFYKNENF
jgi:hypothetical protein